jgi:hypothetical protein
MSTVTYTVRFEFPVDAARLNVILEADVQEHHSETYYVISNFRKPGHGNRPALPPIQIRRQEGVWVHTDSGQATDLSTAVGKAIEAREKG